MKTTLTDYDQQVLDFLNATGTEFQAIFVKNDHHFEDDKETRDIYAITLKRGKRIMSFNFGQSIVNSRFYYTKGKQKIFLDRKLLDKKNLAAYIQKHDRLFMNNGTSDFIHYPKTPTAYEVLAYIQKYDVGSFEDFCSQFGYDNDSRSAERIYKAVCKEFADIERLFSSDEIELLQEIQ